MNIVAILQARMSSTRLPNKVLKNILGKPMLQHQIERTQRSQKINSLVIATSNNIEDSAIIALGKKLNISTYAGHLTNVLDRYYQAAKTHKADIVVRITGDCPLTDPDIIDAVIKQHIEEKNTYTSNVEKTTFPDGLDVEVINFTALEDAWKNASKLSDLEHVTPYIRQQSDIKKGHYLAEHDYSSYRWTVDEPEDFTFVALIYEKLGIHGQYFSSEDIYRLLKKEPDLLKINQNISRNEGYLKSLSADAK